MFYPKYVPAYKIYNTTRGTLLELKTCLKLFIYPPRFRYFDGRKLVVRTDNKLPQAKCLLVVNTKHWYRKGTDLWAKFGKEMPFRRKISSKDLVKILDYLRLKKGSFREYVMTWPRYMEGTN
jgi:hypothetical protein